LLSWFSHTYDSLVKEHKPQYIAEPITEDHSRKKKFPGKCPEKQANHIGNRDIDESVIPKGKGRKNIPDPG
jgi:hypothetical protein